jgi:CBS domain-containing protein
MLKSVEVREYMIKPVTVNQGMTVAEASQVILNKKLSGVVVTDDDNNLVGMLSELDCLKAIIGTVYNGGVPGAELVKDVMTREVEVNHPGEDIISVAATMLDHKHRRRPVVENGKLVGQISCRQLLGAIKDFDGS